MVGRGLVILGPAGCGLGWMAAHRDLLRVLLIELVESRCRGCGFGALALLEPAVHDREEGRHEEESGDGGQQQSADDGAAEGRILLAAFAQAEGHGHHADDHGQGRHEHGAEADEAGIERGLARVANQDLLTARGRS